jgi:hypothetical protein
MPSKDYPVETEQHRQLRDAIWAKLNGWYRFLIAIDGVDGVGKSTLARYLAWQLGMPVVETDMFLNSETEGLVYREGELLAAIQSRFAADRPVIIEGVRVLHLLKALKLDVDFLTWVEMESRSGSQALKLDEYIAGYEPAKKADFLFRHAFM